MYRVTEQTFMSWFSRQWKGITTAPSRPVAEPISNQEFMRQQELAEKGDSGRHLASVS